MLIGTPFWFGPEDRPLFGWLHLPAGLPKRAVVLCPPLGYELWGSYRTYRRLAEALAARGCAVLRFDYDGTGDSSGTFTDPDRLDAWRAGVRHAVAALTARGHPHVVLAGLRMGGTLALLEASAAGVKRLVLWDPVISGRRFVRELKLLGMSAPQPEDGSLEIAGTVHVAATLAALSAVDLMKVPLEGLERVVILDRDDRPGGAALAEGFRKANVEVALLSVKGTAAMLDVPNEDSVVAEEIVQAICNELAAETGSPALPSATGPAEGAFEWNGVPVKEEAVRIGPLGLFGLVGSPGGSVRPEKLVILLNSGTEHHLGPGRAWVEFARALNAQGHATLRADFDGVGDSPLRGSPRTVRPYDPQHLTDVGDFVTFARERGFAKVVVLGLCSGGWMALQAALAFKVDALVCINPQLYWQQGDPVEALLTTTRLRRTEERAREARGQRYHLWSALDAIGLRPPAAQWLGRAVARKVRTLLAFSEGDDGIEYLDSRCQRAMTRLQRGELLSLVRVAGIDHPMHRHSKRPQMLAAISDFVQRA